MKTPSKARIIPALLVILTMATFAHAADPTVNLGSANSFAILAGSTITNTGSTVVNGDLGLAPGSAVTGFPPGTVNGTQHVSDALSIQAKNDLTAAYTDAAGRSATSSVGTELGSSSKTPGVYDSSTGTLGITGTLTLDGQGDPNSVFIFRATSTLTTAGSSSVVLANGAQACNVFWQVGSSATLGTNSSFKGNILALTSATLTTGANVEGRVLARNGAVTLDTSTVTRPVCAAAVVTPTPTPTPVVAPTPTPVTAPVSTPATPTAPVVQNVAGTGTPRLPNTGFAPAKNNSTKNIFILVGLMIASALLYAVRVIKIKKQKV